ncbi:hypothetical protein ACFQZV_09020 [Microbacterium koreense]|uniref:Uncharacterized protein n=1 Tax=Microbacterium koreense TaxID=323761 RepID=A0ABW2ZS15_9MICO
MTTPEQPDTPPLTRKQLRELRNTGAAPIVSPEPTPTPSAEHPADDTSQAQDARPEPTPLPHAAEPAAVAPAPEADASVDLAASPLTRRQARQQERIRTASVPVIAPQESSDATDSDAASAPGEPDIVEEVPASVETPADEQTATSAIRELFAPASDDEAEEVVEGITVVDDMADGGAVADELDHDELVADEVTVIDTVEPDAASTDSDDESEATGDAPASDTVAGDDESPDADATVRPTVNPQLGADLATKEPVRVDLPPSFDDLLAQGTTGSISAPNALILSQTTGDLPIVSPISSTGEVLVTGTFGLPEGLGSTGHAPGTADGHEADAVLVDGELPAHSSPTPIAASAAVSTVKGTSDVIKPPPPEKGGRLMMWLAITAGVLALALVGVLILAFVNGVF